MSTTEEYEACVAIQMETWGSDFTERVPATILRVSQYIGGVTAGAFDTEGSLLGFVFGMTGLRDKQLVHWSDLLAVRRAARDRGLGRRLKLYQRDLVHELGVNTMFWTFDPLVARNAHLNLTRLGARVAEYAQDMYGGQLGRSLHPGLGTDRFIVQWDLASAPESRSSTVNDWAVPHRHDGRRPGVRDSAETPPRISLETAGEDLPDAPVVDVDIPADIDALFAEDARAARRWRDATRRAFVWYLGRGYQVRRFTRDETGRTYYELAR